MDNSDIFKIIEPIVRMRPETVGYENGRGSIVLKYIHHLKINLYKDELKVKDINSCIIAHLFLLLAKQNVLKKYDETKGLFGSFIRMRLYYTVLEEYKKMARGEGLDLSYLEEYIDGFTTTTISGSSTVEDVVYEKEFMKIIRDYYDPEIFDMRVSGLRNMDIAKKLGKTSEQLKHYFYNKKKGLVKHLEKNGYTINDLPESVINKL